MGRGSAADLGVPGAERFEEAPDQVGERGFGFEEGEGWEFLISMRDRMDQRFEAVWEAGGDFARDLSEGNEAG